VRRGESLARELEGRFLLDTQIRLLWLPTIRLEVALHKSNSAVEVDVPQPAHPIESGETLGQNISCLYPTYLRGQAFLFGGQGRAAEAEFQEIVEHSGIIWNCWTGALARLGMARANASQA
jgi:hypothetical protein